MNNLKRSRWLFLSLILIFAFAACTPVATPADGAVPGTGQDSFDADFIRMMVPHHEGALDMARIAQERSQRPEIQQMANDILATQQQEIDQMRTWLMDWYGRDDIPPMSQMPMLEGMPDMGHGHGSAPMDMQAEVDALRAAPEPFDLAFINAMIEHHQSAIDAAQAAQSRAQREEIRQLAEAVIAAQQAEIDQMRAWQQEWYPNQ
jgi:uncharacterized protein (DUF305 family)